MAGELGVIAATKLQAPRSRGGLVPRDALVALLAGAPHTRLTLLSAAAGSGKTTLLALWHQAAFEHRPFAWLSLDRADDDPVRFWACVIEALGTVVPGAGAPAAAALRSRADLEGVVLPLLVNEVDAWEQPVVLVLDDLHEVPDARIHASLSSLVDHLPASLHVAVATREDPPLPLPRLRARDEVVELRGGHLRFTDAEAEAFLNDGLGLGLAAGDVALLQRRTEGWAAGLQLAGLSLRGGPDGRDVATAAAPGDRLVVDYLVAEVLDGVPAGLRAFLLQTSILDRVCPDLGDAVTGEPGSAGRLRELERRNLFTLAVDPEGRWYRYHPLFGETLRRMLDESDPELAAVLHVRAARWWAQAGAVAEAVGHALSAGDAELASDLVAEGWLDLFNRGWVTTVAAWLRALPAERVRDDTRLWLARAWTALDVGALDEVAPWLGARAADDDDRRAWSTVLQALHRFKAGDVDAARAAVREALGAPREDPFWLTVAHLVDGLTAFWAHDRTRDAAAPFAAALALAQADGNALAAHYALGHLALEALERDAAGEARERLAAAAALAEGEPPVAEHFTAMTAALARARLAEADGDRDAAGRHAARAVELAQRGAGAPELAAAREALARPAGRRPRAPLGPAPWRKPLSEGELRVLRLLPSELSLREIGGELYVSLNTVKTHTRSIYAKLRVSAREDAVRRARELELL